MFHTTIWSEHDQEAVAHEEPVEQLRDHVSALEANIQTLRTRVPQIADLQDAHRNGGVQLSTDSSRIRE